MSLSPIKLAKSGLTLLQREIDFYRYRPSAAALEVTWVCNLKCVMCGFGRVRHRTQGELTLNEWKKVLDGLVHLGVRWMNFVGAEPMVRKDDVLQMAAYLSGRAVFRQLNTNGTIMSPSLAKRITELFESVVVSLDAPREKHNQIRGQSGAFERACEGIRMILEARTAKKAATPRLTIHTTVLNANYDVIAEMVDVAEELGVDAISFQYVSQTPQESVLNTKLDGQVIASDRYVVGDGESLLLTEEQVAVLRQKMCEAQQKPHRVKVIMGLLPHLSDASLVTGAFPVHKCYFAHSKLVISPQGDVHICSHLDCCIGNVRNEPIGRIWGNERHRRLARALAQELMPVCANCCHFGANLVPSQYVQLALGKALK